MQLLLLLFVSFNGQLKCCRDVPCRRTLFPIPCVEYCKWLLCAFINLLPSVDSVPHDCPCSHSGDLTAETGPTGCIRTKYSDSQITSLLIATFVTHSVLFVGSWFQILVQRSLCGFH